MATKSMKHGIKWFYNRINTPIKRNKSRWPILIKNRYEAICWYSTQDVYGYRFKDVQPNQDKNI